MEASRGGEVTAAVTRDPPWTPVASLSSKSTRSIASPTAILNGYSSTTSGDGVDDYAYTRDIHGIYSQEKTILLPPASVRVFGQLDDARKLQNRSGEKHKDEDEDDDEVPLAALRPAPSAVNPRHWPPHDLALRQLKAADLSHKTLTGEDTLRSVNQPSIRTRTYSQAAAAASQPEAHNEVIVEVKSSSDSPGRDRSQSVASVASSVASSSSQKPPRPAKSTRRPSISGSSVYSALADFDTSGRSQSSTASGGNVKTNGRPPTLVFAQPKSPGETEEVIQDSTANFSAFSPTDTPSLTGGTSALSATDYTNHLGGSDPRTSVYSSVSSSEWERDREREACYENGLPYSRSQLSLDGSYDPHDHQIHLNGHCPYPPHLNHSGFFHLERELALHATPEPPEVPEKEDVHPSSNKLQVPTSRLRGSSDVTSEGRPVSPASPGFGLGITSDDAIHPSSAGEAHGQGYFDAAIHSAVVAAKASDSQYATSPQSNASRSSIVSNTASPSGQYANRWSTARGYVSRRNTASSVVSNSPSGGASPIPGASKTASRQVSAQDLKAHLSRQESVVKLSPQDGGSRAASRRPSASRMARSRQASLSEAAVPEEELEQGTRPSLEAAWGGVTSKSPNVADADASEELANPFATRADSASNKVGLSSDHEQDTLIFNQRVRGLSSSSSSTRSHAPAPILINGLPHLRKSSEASTVRSRSSLSAFDNTLHSAAASAALATLSYAETNRLAEQDTTHASAQSLDTSMSSAVSVYDYHGNISPVGLGIRLEHLLSASQQSKSQISEDVGQAVQLVDQGLHTISALQPGQKLQDLQIQHDTTHLELANCSQPPILIELFKSTLPLLADTLVVLDISACGLSTIPDTIAVCQHLEELNISRNALQDGTLPNCIGFLRSLRLLIADQCELTLLGRSLASQLPELHTLSLAHNKLQWLPSWLSHFEGSLDVLLIEGNPLHGDYAELVRPLLVEPSVQNQNIVGPAGLTISLLANSVSSKSSVPTLCELYAKDGDFGWMGGPALDASGSRDSHSSVSSGTERLSMFNRARSFRGRIRRPSLMSNAQDASNRNSVNRNSLIVPSALANMFPPSRSGTLRSMKSTSDLVPSPSLQSLIDSPEPESTTFFGWRRSRTETNGSQYPSSTEATPELIHDTPILQSEASDAGESATESDANEEPSAKDVAKSRVRRPSFFRKLTNKLSKKRSLANLSSPDKADMHSDASNALPPLPPFFSETARTHSDPTVTTGRTKKASSRPNLTRGVTSQIPLPTKVREVTKPSNEKVSTAGHLSPGGSASSSALKRRSYLMLTSPLPNVLSPGPLALSWISPQSPLPTSFSEGLTIDEEETINFSSMQNAQSGSFGTSSPARPTHVHTHQTSSMLRRMALAPLLAYLRDLDDLLTTAEAAKLDASGVFDHVRQSESGSVPPSRVVSRKPSMVATSSASSVINRSSEHGSSKGDNTALTSPGIVQAGVTVTDDPIKRKHLLEEIVSTEISYLTSLRELLAVYIEPASAPVRTLGDLKTSETIISARERKKVFSTIESITAYHADIFLPSLQAAVKEMQLAVSPVQPDNLQRTAQRVAQVFIQQAAFLSAPAKSERALGASEKRRIHKLMKNAVTDARHIQMNLESYLLMPIQRVPRYRMLLEGLLACSPDSVDAAQPDALLVAAHSAIALVAQEMNERKRDSEGRQRLLYWQKRLSQGAFPSTLVQVHRSLIREGAGMLSRVAKSAFQPVAIVHTINGKTSCYKLPYLNIEISQKRLAYLLCSDIFVLLEAPQDEAAPATLITVIRLGIHNDGEDVAALFGAGSTLRLRDARAIFYIDFEKMSDAVELRDLLNSANRSECDAKQEAKIQAD